MTQEFDPKTSYLAVKAHEKMIAYVGFDVQIEDDEGHKEGIIKISSFQRPYGGGKLTLTFIVDTKENQEMKNYLKFHWMLLKKFNNGLSRRSVFIFVNSKNALIFLLKKNYFLRFQASYLFLLIRLNGGRRINLLRCQKKHQE